MRDKRNEHKEEGYSRSTGPSNASKWNEHMLDQKDRVEWFHKQCHSDSENQPESHWLCWNQVDAKVKDWKWQLLDHCSACEPCQSPLHQRPIRHHNPLSPIWYEWLRINKPKGHSILKIGGWRSYSNWGFLNPSKMNSVAVKQCQEKHGCTHQRKRKSSLGVMKQSTTTVMADRPQTSAPWFSRCSSRGQWEAEGARGLESA